MQRLTRLDGLRGVLAVYVMLGHAIPFTTLPGWIAGPVHHGEAAVDVFFALSGLVIVNSLERFDGNFRPFIAARARRLLPVYFTVLAFAILLLFIGSPLPAMPWVTPHSMAGQFWATGIPANFPAQLIAHLTLTHGLIPQSLLPYAYITLLGPAWSLSTEWQFYLLAPLARRNLPGFTFALLILGIAYHAAAGQQFSRAFLPDAAPYFALGVATAAWQRSKNPTPLILATLTCALLGLASANPGKACIPAVWLLALAAQFNPQTPLLPRLLNSRPIQYLGAISYPLYLLNEPIQRAAAMLVAPLAHANPTYFTLVWTPLALTTPLIAAAALHHMIERPFLRGKDVGTGVGRQARPRGSAPWNPGKG